MSMPGSSPSFHIQAHQWPRAPMVAGGHRGAGGWEAGSRSWWKARLLLSWGLKSLVYAPLSHLTSLIKHKFKNNIIKHFKMSITEHSTSSMRFFWAEGPVPLHYIHAHEAWALPATVKFLLHAQDLMVWSPQASQPVPWSSVRESGPDTNDVNSRPEFQNSVKSFLCLLLYSVCLAFLDPRPQHERAPPHRKWWAALFSCWFLLPFPEALPSVWAPKRSVEPDPNTCIKLTGYTSSKTLFFLSLLTFLKLHPLTHISSETVLSTGSHCLLLKEAFWPSHDKIDNQTNPTVTLSKWSDSVYRFYRHQPCASGCQDPD